MGIKVQSGESPYAVIIFDSWLMVNEQRVHNSFVDLILHQMKFNKKKFALSSINLHKSVY